MATPEMVLELIKAIRYYQPALPPARLSPAVEHAYAVAEALRREMAEAC